MTTGAVVYKSDKTPDYILTSSGMIRKDGANYIRQYNITDHLGNVRSVVNQSGTVEQATDYYPYGLSFSNNNLTKNRYLYNGKEIQNQTLSSQFFGMYDYGARYYDPVIGRWMEVDPKTADAPLWSPYNAMRNNPIKFVDPDGQWAVDHLDVEKNRDGTYTVIGGQANSDKNIYVVDTQGNRTGEIVGQMLTEYSFHRDEGSAVKGANINLRDKLGQNFFNNEIKNVGLFKYMGNAKGGEPLDFKTRDMPQGLTNEAKDQYIYRGMSFEGRIASARDIGNYSAGYVAGIHGFGWVSSRFAFDALQTKQEKGTWNTIFWYPFNRVREGQPTQQAQREGHNVAFLIFKQRQLEKVWQRATNPYPIGPKW